MPHKDRQSAPKGIQRKTTNVIEAYALSALGPLPKEIKNPIAVAKTFASDSVRAFKERKDKIVCAICRESSAVCSRVPRFALRCRAALRERDGCP